MKRIVIHVSAVVATLALGAAAGIGNGGLLPTANAMGSRPPSGPVPPTSDAPVAAAAGALADIYGRTQFAVRHFHLEGEVEKSAMLCNADLVHSPAALPADYTTKIVLPMVRSTMENVCTLTYAGHRIHGAALGYALLRTPEAATIPRLEDAVEAIIEIGQQQVATAAGQ